MLDILHYFKMPKPQEKTFINPFYSPISSLHMPLKSSIFPSSVYQNVITTHYNKNKPPIVQYLFIYYTEIQVPAPRN